MTDFTRFRDQLNREIAESLGLPPEVTGPMPTPNPKGLYCPECRGTRLVVTTVRRVCPGVTIRYRRCSACNAKIVTEERVARTRKPRPAGADPS